MSGESQKRCALHLFQLVHLLSMGKETNTLVRKLTKNNQVDSRIIGYQNNFMCITHS